MDECYSSSCFMNDDGIMLTARQKSEHRLGGESRLPLTQSLNLYIILTPHPPKLKCLIGFLLRVLHLMQALNDLQSDENLKVVATEHQVIALQMSWVTAPTIPLAPSHRASGLMEKLQILRIERIPTPTDRPAP